MARQEKLNESCWPHLGPWHDDCGPQFAPPTGPRERKVLVQHARVTGTPNPGVPAVMSMAQAARYKENRAPAKRQSSVQTSADLVLAPTSSRRPYYGSTLASMARAAELRAHHTYNVDARELPPDLANTNAIDSGFETMVKRRNWLPLDLSQVTDKHSQGTHDNDADPQVNEESYDDQEVDITLSATESPAFSPLGEDQTVSTVVEEKIDFTPTSTSLGSAIVSSSNHSCHSETPRVASVEYATASRPRVSLPPVPAISKPPSHYPAVKGTTSDVMYHQRRAANERQLQQRGSPLARPPIPVISADNLSKHAIGFGLPYHPMPSNLQQPSMDSWRSTSFFDPLGAERPSMDRSSSIARRHDDEWFYRDSRFSPRVAREITDAWNRVKAEAQITREEEAPKPQSSFGSIGDRRRNTNEQKIADTCDTGSSENSMSSQTILDIQCLDGGKRSGKEDAAKDVMDILMPVLANIRSYQVGPKDYWTQRWVQPPDWCVDRSPAGVQSAFGEDWGTPPARVGRDPRYRPVQGEVRPPPGFSPIPTSMAGSSGSLRDPRQQTTRGWRSESSPQYRHGLGHSDHPSHRSIR